MKRLLTHAALLCALFGLSTLTAPAASASSPPGGICNPGCEANVEFASYGEIFTVHDYAADGHSTLGIIEWYADGRWHRLDQLWNSNGYSGRPVKRNYTLPERLPIRYAACVGEFGTGLFFDCSTWHYDRA